MIEMGLRKTAVSAAGDVWAEKAEKLACRLGVPFVRAGSENSSCDLLLVQGDEGLSLTGNGMELRCDFTHMLPRLKQANLQQEFLVKAVKIKGIEHQLQVLDATAGFAEDSLLLAAAGFSVRLYEYNPVIAALLTDALERASEIPELRAIVGRMDFREGDSISAMRNLDYTPDVILLDPMFPERQKSASVKKKFQLLQKLELPCGNEREMLSAAFYAAPKKIIVKRPAKGPYLADVKPSYSFTGKAVRYDCIIPASAGNII